MGIGRRDGENVSVDDLRAEVAKAIQALEDLGWVWKGTDEHGLLHPPRTDDPGTDHFARREALAAIERRLMGVENSWLTLDPDEQRVASGFRLAAINLRDRLYLDSPMSDFDRQLQEQKAKTADLQQRLEGAEAEVGRFREGVGRGWAVIVVGTIVSFSLASEMGWRRDDVVFVWLILAACWWAVWGRSPRKKPGRR